MNMTGGHCQPGFYCAQGSSAPILCTAGQYCADAELDSPTGTCTHLSHVYYYNNTITIQSAVTVSAVNSCCRVYLYRTGDCDAGYYCPGGDTVANPTDTICPRGRYCPQGSATPTPCPEGTFSNATGLTQESECTSCTAGIITIILHTHTYIPYLCTHIYLCTDIYIIIWDRPL